VVSIHGVQLNGLLCLLIVDKLVRPRVFLLENLVERLDVPVLLSGVLPDELVLADA